MRVFDLSHKSVKFLDTLDAKQYRQVMKRIVALAKDPRPHDSQALGSTGSFRIDVGEYRVIYSFDAAAVRIETVGPRNDGRVYRHLR